MSLDLNKLEQVRDLEGGLIQARCPACAEEGHDRTGNHLRVYPDGRYGCCVHPKEGRHRKRIFALAGLKAPESFAIRVKTPAAVAAKSVKAVLSEFSLGTPEVEPEASTFGVPGETRVEVPPPIVSQRQCLPHLLADGTLVIPFSSPERYHWWKGGQSVAATRAELLAQGQGPESTPTDSRS